MPFIIQIPPQSPETKYSFPKTPFDEDWDEVYCGDSDQLRDRFDIVISAKEVDFLIRNSNGALNVALWCDDFSFLENISMPSNITVIFSPGFLATIEAERLGRMTLIARRALARGSILQSDDLSEIAGGVGVTTNLRESFIARELAYDLMETQSIDFGCVL